MDKKRILIETLPFLFLAIAGGALAGLVLGGMKTVLQRIPGLIIVVPAIIGIRGNICSSMGSRLGSAYHLGALEDGFSSQLLFENLKGSLSLSIFVSALLPFFVWFTSLFLPFSLGATQFFALILITILTGIVSGFLLSFLVFSIVILSAKFKIDPDNISAPILTTAGDILTLLILFFFGQIIGGIIL